eukprot:CAMPEP_0197838866 /NCGR_PEP_ID=MMETSP1437-20131217/39549_1 /TAXON_ID=49252 ORGANISM="Eucampia antarctica, Strain CCMP1452" /NCGR_SAMPLE_ID=MMETSP1437 /ASSEMBLY_ACC=CAM_ASM_001096 /LENGTH=87 /DNA_ID=CAMNT_0043447313 /DNA_START=9 /DNA_END=269 /DNA_ORIENTATION=-
MKTESYDSESDEKDAMSDANNDEGGYNNEEDATKVNAAPLRISARLIDKKILKKETQNAQKRLDTSYNLTLVAITFEDDFAMVGGTD